jgi:multidrug efflux pump subunit AcrA (membrane-fusion protein)
MNARVKIVCDRATGVPAVTLAALHSEENQTYVLVPAASPGAQPEKRDVALGLRGQSLVEVKSGLSTGDKYLVRKPKTGINIREGQR